MILASMSLPGALLAGVAIVVYILAAAAAWGGRLGAARGGLLLAWLAHALQILWSLASDSAHFGFAQALSVTIWFAVGMYLYETWRYESVSGQAALAVCGALSIVLALVYPGAVLPQTTSPLLALHWALGLSAYGLFAVAVAHGWLLTRTEQRLRAAPNPRGERVPLLKQERLMFRFVSLGFLLLTLTLIAGLFFGEQLYGPEHAGWTWDHKHVFTVLSWLVFALLLLGHWWLGWRGRRAVHILYLGAALLLLGYAGSRFVLEALLQRNP